jgi:glycosyltransferase involved in cell wall biosynthesis
MELRNKVVMAPKLPALIAFENREVRRHAAALGRRPSARIAVVVPTYRRPQQLLVALDSILKQEVQDFVVMVVDDGAGLPELPKDPRITGVSLSRNSAVLGLVRNVGIRLTESRYIAFLDDDNTWTPQHLTLTIGALEAGADFVYSDLRRLTEAGVEMDVVSGEFDRRTFSDSSSWVDSNAIVVRRTPRTLFSRLPRVKATLPKEDWEFTWRQTRGARVTHVATPTVEYLVNPESYYTRWRLKAEHA